MICRNRSRTAYPPFPSPGTPREGRGDGLIVAQPPSAVPHQLEHIRERSCHTSTLWLVLLGLLTCGIAQAENWPSWRGPEGTGVSSEKNLPLKWSAKENVRWHTALPDRGNSTPVVWGDRVFITQATEKDHRRTVMCFSRSDGKLLWQSGVTCNEAEPTNGQNPYCAASPVTDGQRVIACFGSAGLYCYDLDGKELWHRDLGKVDSWHGSGSSPVIVGRLCVINFGPGTSAALVACDKETGEIVWKVKSPKVGWAFAMPGFGGAGDRGFEGAAMSGGMSGRGGFNGSWSTPLLIRAADRDELVVVQPAQVAALDPKTGKELWTCKGLPEQVFASPAFGEGILVASGHSMNGGGSQVIAVKPGGDGDVTETHRLWQIRLPKDCVGSPVIADGHVYLVTDFGSIVCLELTTGKKLAEKRLSGEGSRGGSWSSFVLADGKLFLPNHSGEVFVVRASPDLEQLQMNSVGDETTCASLAASDGQIFLRTYQALWCFGAGSGKQQSPELNRSRP
jgi:outer membrane protein assembly factor BamB